MSQPPPNAPTITPLEAVLRDACARALAPMVTLKLTMMWYRSVTALARSLREMHADAGQPRGFCPDMIALLQAVHTHACQQALDPSLPALVVASLHRSIAALGRAEHLAHPVKVKKQQKSTVQSPAPEAAAATHEAFNDRLEALLTSFIAPTLGGDPPTDAAMGMHAMPNGQGSEAAPQQRP